MSLPPEFWKEDLTDDGNEKSSRPRTHPAVRIYAFLRSGILSLGAVVGVACIAAFAVSLLFGVRPLVVISGSMEPTIPVGSVVFSAQVSAGELKEGSIATVERPRNLGLVTHRVVKSVEPASGVYELTLKGDANAQEDPEPYTVQTAGKYVWHVVGLGYIASFLQSQDGMIFALAAGLLVLALFVLDPVRSKGGQKARDGATHGKHS